jgi:hypothetical protein
MCRASTCHTVAAVPRWEPEKRIPCEPETVDRN